MDKDSLGPLSVFVCFCLGQHILALSRQTSGVNLQTLVKSSLVSGQLMMATR